MSSDRVVVERRAGILRVTLNRPEKRNAIDAAMVEELHRVLERAELDADIRVVLVRGAGKDFCAGADLAELLASADQSAEQNEAHALRLGEVFLRMRRSPKPVVAAVHGRALAGGCGLATACDLVLAHAEATFGYPEVRRGFVPAMVIAMLRRAVGEKAALDLVLTGRLLTAADAHGLGLVSRVMPAEEFEDAIESVTAELARSSPSALALIKQQVYELDDRSFEDGIRLGARVNAVARSTPDFKDAVARFLERT